MPPCNATLWLDLCVEAGQIESTKLGCMGHESTAHVIDPQPTVTTPPHMLPSCEVLRAHVSLETNKNQQHFS